MLYLSKTVSVSEHWISGDQRQKANYYYYFV